MPFTRRQTLVALAFSFSILLIWRLQAAERSAIGATSNPLKHSSTQDEYEITHVEEEDVVRGWYMDEDKKRTEVGTGEKQKQIVAGEPPKVAEPKSEEKEGWIIPAVYSGKLSKLSAPTFPYKFSPTSPKSVLQAALLTAHISSNIPNTLIPRIIHQTWRTRKVGSNMPVHVADSIESWRKENPDYIHLLWDDKDMDDFISTFWPSYWQAWKAFPMPVMRADVFRYLVLVTFGGVYTDADTLCLRPVDRWVEAKELEGWTYPPRESSKAPRKAFPTVGPSTVAFIGGLETDVPFDREDWTGIYHV
ncbi:hypothetical protein HK104_001887 [Borealophlyctis nickersoniae]|nr:hypothetical protein HK104_001887 [Borealophlyctis nickersoniae]